MSAEEKQILGVGSRVTHTQFGSGVVVESSITQYKVYFKTRDAALEISINDDRLQAVQIIEAPANTLTLKEVEHTLSNLLRQWGNTNEIVPLGERWKHGTMVLQPANNSLKPKEIPIETFFHKIIMTRDRLRVMEQKINASALSNEEKIELQQYLTRIYGSLTTFNILFAQSDQQFKGTSSE